MTKQIKDTLTGMITYGYFTEASETIAEYVKANPKDTEVLPFVSMLKEKVAALNTALEEQVDLRFFELMERIATRSEDEVFEMILDNFNNSPPDYMEYITKYLIVFQSLWGRIDPKNGDYESFYIRARSLKTHYDDIMWLHDRLADARSKNTLFAMLSNWVDMDYVSLGKYKELVFPEYFDPVIFPRRCDEVFVDLGAAAGNSALDFMVAHVGKYKHIYCYEITPNTFEWLKVNLQKYPNITMRQKGAWSSPGTMRLKEEPGGTDVKSNHQNR